MCRSCWTEKMFSEGVFVVMFLTSMVVQGGSDSSQVTEWLYPCILYSVLPPLPPPLSPGLPTVFFNF